MKVVAVLGDSYHDETTYKRALSLAVANIDNVVMTYTTREDLLNELKNAPDVVIMASGNRLDPENDKGKKWLTNYAEQQITEYVNKGGGWFAWHAGLAGYDDNDAYTNMLGGYFTHHPEKHVSVRYRYLDKHELNQYKEYFSIEDEHYFIKRVEKSSYFLESFSEHGTSDAGWTRRFGEGKVCCYTPAHNIEGLMDKAVQKDIRDIIEWFFK